MLIEIKDFISFFVVLLLFYLYQNKYYYLTPVEYFKNYFLTPIVSQTYLGVSARIRLDPKIEKN